MTLGELVASLLMNKQVSSQDRLDAGQSILPQAGGIDATAQITELRKKMMDAYRTGDYELAQQLQSQMMQLAQQMQPIKQ